MESAGTIWRKFLVEWPNDIPQQGVIVTSFEQVVFVGFLLKEHVAIFERRAPDTVGGRRIILPYASIQAVKIVDPIDDETLLESGFRRIQSKTTEQPQPI